MEQIMVRVRDESKVDLLVNLLVHRQALNFGSFPCSKTRIFNVDDALGSLDFVDEVRTLGEVKTHPENDNGVEDFFSLAGL